MTFAKHRYCPQKRADSQWSVIDTFSGLPAASDGHDLVGLEFNDAMDISDMLNEADQRGKTMLV